jgi:hypothetical protein
MSSDGDSVNANAGTVLLNLQQGQIGRATADVAD